MLKTLVIPDGRQSQPASSHLLEFRFLNLICGIYSPYEVGQAVRIMRRSRPGANTTQNICPTRERFPLSSPPVEVSGVGLDQMMSRGLTVKTSVKAGDVPNGGGGTGWTGATNYDQTMTRGHDFSQPGRYIG